MKTSCALLATALISGCVLSLQAEDWPCFRGPSRQGISTEKNVPLKWGAQEQVAWKTPLPGNGWASPIIEDGRVYIATAMDNGSSYHLIRLDAASGATLWDKELFKQDVSGRKEGRNSFATSTPATDGQRVYVLGFDGTMAAITPEGQIAWVNHDFKYYSQHGPAVSPMLYKDLVIIPFDQSSPGPDKLVGWQKPWDQSFIVALDQATGKVKWKASRGLSRIAHVTPNVMKVQGIDQLISSAGDVIQGFNLETGERLWTVTSFGESPVPSIVGGEGLVFTSSGFGKPTIRAVRPGGKGDVTATNIAWEYSKDVPMMASFIYVNPRLYAVSEGGVVTCFEAATGKVLWREKLEGHYAASPIWTEGRIYLLSDEGDTTVIEDGNQFKVLAKNSLGEPCQSSPAIANGRIYLRTEKNLFCIGK